MATLKGKAKGDVRPQGKPKVYFSCHPADFDLYFKEICHDIWETHDCAIYYYDESDGPVVPDEEYYARLGEMQLFVMPVTGRLLLDANRGRDIELAFAREHHKPVLPLMMEEGLVEPFGKVFGDLQFLDKYTRDVTAIAYEEKLKKFLDSIFVDDELAKKVRAAFDAYIFLSYRKKDRKYAQELMRLIHKNEFCRDIAIWYDEFLTPGEDFNKAIEAALKKSDLFALAVTPNLLEEENYVMTDEYPMARKTGKPVFPAELVQTDKAALKEKFEELPACADAYDDVAFSRSLLETLQQIAIKENDKDPQHNFFIGLAYLGGIDVEVDCKRAVSLITSAADAGLVVAMEKLANMYRNGEGVAVSESEVLKWKERLAQAVAGDWKAPGCLNFEYAKRLAELGDFCLETMTIVDKLKKARDAFYQLKNVAEDLCQKTSHYMAKAYLAKSYEGLGDIFQRERKYDLAKAFFQKNLELCEENHMAMVGKSEAKVLNDVLFRMAMAKQKIGLLAEKEGKIGEVCDYFLQSYHVLQGVAQSVGAIQAVQEANDNYAVWERVEKDGKVEWEKQPDETGGTIRWEYTGTEPWAARALTLCEEKLGDYFLKTNQLRAARKKYEEAFDLRKSIAGHTEYIGDQYQLAGAYGRLGDLCHAEGDLPQALVLYFQGVDPYRVKDMPSVTLKPFLYKDSGAHKMLWHIEKAFRQVEQELLAKKREEFAPITALPDFMLLLTNEKWDLDYNAPEEEVWHYELLENFFRNNAFSTKEEWMHGLQAEYKLLQEKGCRVKRILTAFENAITELEEISLEEIKEAKEMIADGE